MSADTAFFCSFFNTKSNPNIKSAKLNNPIMKNTNRNIPKKRYGKFNTYQPNGAAEATCEEYPVENAKKLPKFLDNQMKYGNTGIKKNKIEIHKSLFFKKENL